MRDPFELEQPSVRKIIDVGEDRCAVDQIEVSILKRQMGLRRYRSKIKRRIQVLLARYNVTSADVDAPNLTLCGEARKPSDHSAWSAAEI